MVEATMNKLNASNVDTELDYDQSVIAKIVGKTLADIPGVFSVHGNMIENLTDRFSSNDDPTKGIKVDLDNENDTVSLEMDTTLEYGKNVPKIFDEAVKKIHAAVNDMTGITVNSVKMTVKDLLTKEEWDAQQNKNNNKEDDH